MNMPSTALAAILFGGLCVSACGGTGGGGGSTASSGSLKRVASNAAAITTIADPPPHIPRANADVDKDGDGQVGHYGMNRYDYDDKQIVYMGHPASAADRQSIAVVVKNYFAAAAAHDGAKLCAGMYSLIAESVPEDYGEPPAGPPGFSGKTCAVVLSKLFAQRGRERSVDTTGKLEVTGVRVREGKALALLRFGTAPIRYIWVRREYKRWKVDTLLDIGIP
jgi:hypothetical protein